jgi:hypothetical protein
MPRMLGAVCLRLQELPRFLLLPGSRDILPPEKAAEHLGRVSSP